MSATTPVYDLPYPLLASDSPDGPAQLQALALATETALGTAHVGVPATATTSLSPSAWTTVCSTTVTVASHGFIEVVAWARLINTGAGRAMVALQVVDGSTHLFGSGEKHIGGTGDTFGEEDFITLPRRRIGGLTPGSHTITLQAYKDANGSIDVKKTDTYASQAIATTGIEVVA